MSVVQYVTRLSQREYSARTRLAAMACESLIFVFGIPAFLFFLGRTGSDIWRFRLPPALMVFCQVTAVLGLLFSLWTVWAQFRYARGTPVPVMATQVLLTDRPYSLCRNPMALGTFVFYFSLATITSSLRAVLAVVFFASLLITYIKLIEEKELSLRFGDDYARYRENTPFLIPRLTGLVQKPADRR